MKTPIWAISLTLISFFILCGLGIWQLQRLEWKTRLLQKIESYKHSDFQDFSVANMIPSNEFQHGKIEGTFSYDKEIAIQSRTNNGTPGVHVITPLILKNGNTLLVNRGWAPLDYKLNTPDKNHQARQTLSVSGIIRTPQKPNIFVPQNDVKNDKWYRLDIEKIGEAKKLNNILPVLLYETDLLERSHGTTYPDPNALGIRLNNNHLQYALFWFAMAAALATVYTLRFITKQPDK